MFPKFDYLKHKREIKRVISNPLQHEKLRKMMSLKASIISCVVKYIHGKKDNVKVQGSMAKSEYAKYITLVK